MSEWGQDLLEQIPVHLRGVHQLRASANAQGDEVRLLNDAVDRLVNGLAPLTADGQFLALFEALLGLSVGDPLRTLAQRRAVVLAYMARMTADGSGAEWRRLGDQLIGSGWTYQWGTPSALLPTNQVLNPNYESDAANWFVGHSAGVVAGTFARQTGWFQDGAASLRVSGTNAADTTSRQVSARTATGVSGMPTQADRTYSAKAVINVVNAASQGFRLAWNWYQADGSLSAITPTVSAALTGAGSTGVMTLSLTAAAPPDAAYRALFVQGFANTASDLVDFYVDSVIDGRFAAPPTYFDGATAGYEWLGATNASASRQTNTGPAANNVLINLPFPSTSADAQLAQTLFESITAATVIINYVFTDSFRLDASLLDSTSLLA